MALEQTSTNNEINIEQAVGKIRLSKEQNPTNAHQSELYAKINKQNIRFSIIATQPIYSNETGTGFTLVDKDFMGLMGYKDFKLHNIFYHDKNTPEVIKELIKSKLNNLTNL